jgi:hypothetical protein
MTWKRVDTQESMSATALIEDFQRTYKAAEVPPGVEVFHSEIEGEGHSYFFSPVASSIAQELLQQVGAVPCPKPEGLNNLQKLKL